MGFFTDVLGATGKVAFVLAPREEGAALVHKWVDLSDPASVRDGALLVDQANEAGADAYFTPALYAGEITRKHINKGSTGLLGRHRGRLRANVVGSRAFWVDIDAGKIKWGRANEAKRQTIYRTRKAAMVAVGESLDAIGTLADPTYVVNSGTGIHLYWCMDDVLDTDMWTAIAERLRDTLLASGLRLDRSRSRDAASIMRFPGSIHWSETERRGFEVRGGVLGEGRFGDVLSPEGFVSGLVASEVKPAKQDAPGHHPRTVPAASTATQVGKFYVPAGALSASNERAAQSEKLPPPAETDHNVGLVVSMLAARGSDLSYEEWRDVIWAVKDTGWDIAYEMLEQWCALSEAQWEKPWEDELRKVWESDNGGTGSRITCASLIAWARRESGVDTLRFLSEAESNIAARGSQLITVEHPGRGEASYVLPELPKGYMRKEDEPGIWTRIANLQEGQSMDETDDDEIEWEWFKFIDIDVFMTDRVQNEEGEHILSLAKIEPHAGIEVFDLPAGITSSIAKVSEALSGRSIFTNGVHGWKHMSRYLVEQGKTLIQAKTATSRLSALGWHGVDDDRAFAFGDAAYDIHGHQQPVQYAPRVALLAKSTKSRGTLTQWLRLPALYSGPSYATAQAMILMSMGAPLHSLTGERGGVVNLFTEGSGYGKTAVLQTALSVWSGTADMNNAETLLMGDKTDMAAEFKLTQANSLPVGLDELTSSIHGSDGKRLQAALRKFIYGSTQGRGKARLKSSGDGLRESGTWDTFLMSTANASLESIFASDSARSGDAERARVLDLDGGNMPKVSDFQAAGISLKELTRRRDILTRVLPNTYGVAGEALLAAYFDDFPTTEARVLEVFAEYQHQYGMRDRFIVAKMTIARVAWEFAHPLGLVDYEWEPIEAVIREAIEKQHEAQRDSKSADPEALVNEYMRLFAGQIAMVKHIGGKPVPFGFRAPRDPLVGRWEVDHNKLYLLRAELKAFCAENRVNLDTLDQYLWSTGAVKNKGVKVSLGKGHGISGQHYAIEIDPIAAGIVEQTPEEKDYDEDNPA